VRAERHTRRTFVLTIEYILHRCLERDCDRNYKISIQDEENSFVRILWHRFCCAARLVFIRKKIQQLEVTNQEYSVQL
jgi:hypothetical protein